MPLKIVRKAEPISTEEDVARSAGTGLIEGGASTFGGLGDAREMIGAGVQWAGKKLGLKEVPEFQLPAFGPVETARKVAVAGLNLAGMDPRKARLVTAMMGPGGVNAAPTTKEVLGAVTKDKPLYQPQTRAGKYSRTVAAFAPAALGPGGPVRRVANVVVPSVASEAAGQATEGTPLEPYARLGGALAGGLAVNMAGRGGGDTRLLAEASRPATDAQIASARALMEQAQARGLQLTMAEALEQVSGSATGMARMQRVVEGTPAGSSRLGPTMAQRPAQVARAVTDFADTIAPAAPDPYVLGQRASGAADDVLTGVRQQINANARPWYDALREERMPAAAPGYQGLVQNPAYQEALGQVRGNPVLNAQVANLPDDSLAVVNEVVKQLDTLAQNAAPNPASATGNAQMSAAYGAAARQADELASAVSEPWRLSRAMVGSGREAFLEPLQAGPMGAISQSPKVGSQTAALFPNAPAEGAAPMTGQTLQMLPPDVGPPLVRQHVMNSFGEAAQQNVGGENQWGGAKWAAQIAGNPEQARVLGTGVEAVGGDRANFDALLEALRATGRRERPGSMTEFNRRGFEELGQAGTGGEALKFLASGPSMFRRAADYLQNWQTSRNADQLAQAIIASPAEAERILLHARAVVPQGQALEAIERLALAAQLSRQQQLEGR